MEDGFGWLKKPVEPPQNYKQKKPTKLFEGHPHLSSRIHPENPAGSSCRAGFLFFSHCCVSAVSQIRGLFLGLCWAIWKLPCGAMLKLCWGGLADGGGIFVGHEPFHLRAPQNAQIGGLFLGLCWAIWKRCWPKMAVHVGHPVHFGNLNAKKTPYWPKLYPNCLKETNPENYHELPAELLIFLNIDLSSTFGQRNLNRFLSPQKVNLGVGVLLDHPRNPSNLTLQNSTSPQIGQKYQTIPNWYKFTQTVWKNQTMRT